MEVRILGPVEVAAGGRILELGRRQSRLILGILALQANRPVHRDRLIDLIWGPHPPAHARAALHSRVSELRAKLDGSDREAGGGKLLTKGSGYLFEIAPECIDAHQFSAMLAESREAGADHLVRDLLRKALNLWRGQVLGGFLPTESHDGLCQGLEAARLTAMEDLFEVELRLGRHYAVVDELIEVSAANPSRERLTGQAMLALCRTGRTAEALHTYRRCQQWLAQELGIDPGQQLAELHVAILRGDAELAQPPAPPKTGGTGQPVAAARPRPQTLPADIPDFTGRESEVLRLCELLTSPDRDTVVVAAIAGPAGVGKTTLSVHVATRVRAAFPDGQLFANLRGTDRDAIDPGRVLGRFLRSLGVDGLAVPDEMEDRVALYRGLLAGKRVLVVLDNVGTGEQVLPLIPGEPGCAVLVNSRVRLGALLGASGTDLDPLAAEAAVRLLSHIAGPERVDPACPAAAELVRLCGYLPLAIRIVAATLAVKPHWTVDRLVNRLADEHKRLDHLAFGHLNVRSSIALSMAGLAPDALRLLRRLGDLDLPDVNVWTGAALLDTGPARAEDVLEQLRDAQLVNVAGAAGQPRYRLHDLVRLLARERAGAEESPADLAAARTRVYGAWLFVSEAVHQRVYGGSYLNITSPAARWPVPEELVRAVTADPLGWFDLERQSIAAVVRRAADDGRADLCWGLACVTSPLFQMRGDYDLWPGLLADAYAVTERAGDHRGRAAMLHRTGMLCADRRQYPRARDHFQRACALFRLVGDEHGRAVATAHTAMIDRWSGRHDLALDGYLQALPGLREHDDHGGEAFTLRSIGQTHLELGDHAAADRYLGQALRIARRAGYPRGEAQILFWQGMLRLKQCQHDDAERLFTAVLDMTRALRDAPGEVQARRGLGLCQLGRDDLPRASAELSEALRLVRQPSLTFLEAQVLEDLSNVENNRRGRPAKA